MAEEGLKIKIGADVVEVVQSLNQLQTEFNDLNKQIKNAVPGSTQFNNLSAQLDVIKTKIKAVNDASVNAGSTGLKNLTKGANQANSALVNFSRVASDAPFGLIGIANNIDPLVQSFVSLRKETGSGKAALSALAASLTGGGGLILGISLVTSALQFLELGFSRWGASADKTKEKTKEVKDETKDYQTILKEVTSQLSQEAANVTVLVQTLKSETSTREQRNNAIKELNKISPEIFKNLSSERTEIDKLNVSYQNYINTLNARIKIQVLEKQLTQILEKELVLQDKNNAQTKARLENEKLVTALKDQYVNKLQDKQIDQNNILYKNWKNTVTVENELAALSKQRTDLLDNIVSLQNEYNDSLKTTTEETINTKNSVDEIAEAIKNYNNQLKGINWDEQNRQIDGTKKRLELAGETLKILYLAGVKETSSAWKEVSGNYEEFEKKFKQFLQAEELKKIQVFIQKYKEGIAELDIKQSITGQDQLNSRINLTIDALIELKKAGQENTAQYQELQNTLNNLKAEVGLREIRKRQQEIADIWQKYTLQADKLNFNKTRGSLDILKSKIDLIGNTIQELRSKGWTDQDLGIQVLGAQLNGLLDQFSKLKEQKEIFDTLRQTIEGGLTNAFGSVFEAIADGQDAFKALSDSIKRLVLDLIKAVIQMTIVKAIANAIAPGVGGQAVDVVQKGVIRGDTFGFLLSRGQ